VQDPAAALPGTAPPETESTVIGGAVDPYGAARLPSAGDRWSGYASCETAVGAVAGDPLDTPESPVAVTLSPVGRFDRGRGLGDARHRRRRR